MNEIETAFNTLANFAGGHIENDQFIEENSTKNYKITKNQHDEKDFYCLTVPTGAFVIKSDDKISITGNCHVLGDVFLYKTVYDELKQNSIDLDAFEKAIKQNQELIIQAAKEIYAHEEYVVDMIFESGSIEGITEKQMKNFIQSRINEILNMLDIKPIFKVTYNPIADWFYDGINSYQLHDFFTGIGNQYNRDWDESRFVWVQGELE